jgi:isocitrate/isopropylmalate dehydrogenase
LSMMLEYLGHRSASLAVESAVRAAIAHDETTRDLGGALSTEAAGKAIAARLRETDATN